MTSPSLRRSIGLALVSIGLEVVEGLGVDVGVLSAGVAGVLGSPGPCLTPSKLTSLIGTNQVRENETHKRYQT